LLYRVARGVHDPRRLFLKQSEKHAVIKVFSV
jgi:hypothetical protein